MEILVGVTLALLVCGAARLLGMDRDRAFYPAMVMAVASYYVAFAVYDGSARVLLAEALLCAGFTSVAVVGFRRSQWIVAGALAGHGVMDLFHHLLVSNAGVPTAWPGFCMAFDLTAAACVGAGCVGPTGKRTARTIRFGQEGTLEQLLGDGRQSGRDQSLAMLNRSTDPTNEGIQRRTGILVANTARIVKTCPLCCRANPAPVARAHRYVVASRSPSTSSACSPLRNSPPTISRCAGSSLG